METFYVVLELLLEYSVYALEILNIISYFAY